MDLAKVIQQLHEERDRLDAAILSLERLQDTAPRRGRPPLLPDALRKPERAGRKSPSEILEEPAE